MVQQVSDFASNAPETIAHAARVIGKSAHRRAVFDAIYTGKQAVKSVPELMKTTNLPRTRVLDAGKRLADNHIVEVNPTKVDGATAYRKVRSFQSHKRAVLALVDHPKRLKDYVTKRNPAPSRVVTVKLSSNRADIKLVTVDDIGSFGKVRTVASGHEATEDRFSEDEFKRGLQKILGETGKFKDWGGEVADLFTSHFRVSGRRLPVGIALKGPATKGKLTPGKLGKNGDQIQRMFSAPADVFLIQYCRQIDISVLEQMKGLAIAKSVMEGCKRVYYGVIDGQDSARLVSAYPNAFPKRDLKGSSAKQRKKRKKTVSRRSTKRSSERAAKKAGSRKRAVRGRRR